MRILAAALLAMIVAEPATAQSRETIGTGRSFNNDYFGDGRDRWRTGSYTYSHLRATGAYDPNDRAFGNIIEYRLKTEIISPGRGGTDRPYVGAISLGARTHFGDGPWHYALGADVTFIGPQTGLSNFQEAFHEAFDLRAPLTANELPNDTIFGARASASYTYRMSDQVSLRPFAEVLTGPETVARLGADILVGPVGQTDLWLRDDVTGQPYRGTDAGVTGVSFLAGADYAFVEDSVYLPANRGVTAMNNRSRARLGVLWQPLPNLSVFYGATYLSEEFVGQSEGQVVGSLRLGFNF